MSDAAGLITAEPADGAFADADGEVSRAGRSAGRASRRPYDVAIAAYVFCLLVAASPQVLGAFSSPKQLVTLLVVGPGLVMLAVQVCDRDRAAIAGAAFVGVAGLATVLAPTPMLAFLGGYNDGRGWVLVATIVGGWALGRRVTPDATRGIGTAILLGAALNAAFAWLQIVDRYAGGVFDLVSGRAPALMGNPVHASALFAGAAGIVACRWPEGGAPASSKRAWALAAMLFGSALQISGGRIGLGLAIVVVAMMAWRRGPVPALVFALALAVGVAGALVTVGSGDGAASRVTTSANAGIEGRVDRWALAAPAIGERPLLGVGPGLFRRATSPHNTVAAARAFGPDSLNIDAHNVLVEYAVTTGLLGLAAFVLWLVHAGRGTRGELAWFAAAAGFSLLFQPQYVGLAPVVAVALGAARPARGRAVPAPARVIAALLALVGLVVGAAIVRADAHLLTARNDLDAAAARAADDLMPMWPEPRLAEAQAYRYLGVTTDRADAWRAARRAQQAGVGVDPSDPTAWIGLARLELDGGTWPQANRAFRQALHWNPQSLEALVGAASMAAARGDEETTARLCARARQVWERPKCPRRFPRPGG